MPVLTDYARNLLSRALSARGPSLPTAVYAALGTGGTVAAGLSGEPAGNGYARQKVIFTGTGTQQNAEALRFVFTGSAGTVTHIGLYDAAAGGNALAFGPLTQNAPVTGAGTVTIAAGTLTLSAE
ncbi:phage tail fiber protein [Roseomonas marmotae]|uniref:Uncharacterized protein n=1 Tax=Roseomonas marmotae TaxID=2768161 RepID=A0ABS3KBM2_9PROT|nr:hypothetical protein [Roseomonas marmotae]MBO1074875.1 hypothetical protein [Roseomonas marmotae]QTI80622.1 hypothetical protein IAI58_07810 [Roseomonas marmotae]